MPLAIHWTDRNDTGGEKKRIRAIRERCMGFIFCLGELLYVRNVMNSQSG